MTETIEGLASKLISRRGAMLGFGAGASLVAMPWIARAESETIRIGFPTPLTGPYAAEARDQVKSAELAVKLINDNGGVADRKVELLVRDDKLNAGEAATRTLELIESDKVHAIVGALSSAVQLAVNEVTRARGVIEVCLDQPVRHDKRGEGLQPSRSTESARPLWLASKLVQRSRRSIPFQSPWARPSRLLRLVDRFEICRVALRQPG
jgi:Periplasmic binding protein